MTISTLEYALIAGASYRSTRDDRNRIPYPYNLGWRLVEGGLDQRVGTAGFEARAFIKGDEVVISYAGTYFPQAADVVADIALGVGFAHNQLLEAAQYYLDIKKAYAKNPDIHITFTGHSLGGGLATLMGIFFNKTAVTFDQGPFELAANLTNKAILLADLALKGYDTDSDLTSFWGPLVQPIPSLDPIFLANLLTYLAPVRGENNITNLSVQGEFLSGEPFNSLRLGQNLPQLTHQSTSDASYTAWNVNTLHSVSLLIAFYYSSLGSSTTNMPYLVKDLFDTNLFAADTGTGNTKQNDFLTNLIRYEFGIPGEANTQLGLLTKFAADVAKMANSAITDLVGLAEPLLKVLMNYYYQQEKSSDQAPTEFLTFTNGSGVQFDLTKIQAAQSSEIKGFTDLLSWILTQAPQDAAVQNQIKNFLSTTARISLPLLNQTTVTTNDDSVRDFMLAGDAGSNLNGGGGDDLLIGKGDTDILTGGEGSDILIGGDGSDTYIFSGDFGSDTIIDQAGQIQINNLIATGGKETANNSGVYLSADGKLQYSKIGNDLLIYQQGTENTVLVKDWNPGNLGISLSGNGNDLIQGSDYSDVLYGLGGDDTIWGYAGDDVLIGGKGDDVLAGGAGNDVYVYYKGDGNDDIINEHYYKDQTRGSYDTRDTLEFIDALPADIAYITHDKGNLVLSINRQDRITIWSYFIFYYEKLNQIQFSDGTIWDESTINALAINGAVGTDGDDTIHRDGDNLLLLGFDGNDSIRSEGSNNSIDGGAGDDFIDSEYGSNDTLNGGAGNDSISCHSFSSEYGSINTINGGAGNDTIESGASSVNTYLFNRGDGQDVISDYDGSNDNDSTLIAGADQIKFGSGIGANDLTANRSNEDLVVKIKGSNNQAISDQITIQNWFYSDDYKIEQWVFSDGSALTAAQLTQQAAIFLGTENADLLKGWEDIASTISGLGGDDTISGGWFNDILKGDDGNDIITDIGGDNTIEGGEGNDVITTQRGGINLFTGGPGNDRITSNGSTDTYVFNRGDGQDIISDSSYSLYIVSLDADKIKFGAGISATDLSISRNNNNLVIQIKNPNNASANDQITIQNWFAVDQFKIEKFVFANGSTLGNFLIGTDAADSLTGTNKYDYIDGGKGADTLTGGKGNDVYIVDNIGDKITELSNAGIDTVQSSITYTLGSNLENLTLTGSGLISGKGNSLNNTITGNSAANTLSGGAGDDLLNGGAGADTLIGGVGNDTYVVDNIGDKITENLSEGTDTVQSTIAYTLGANLENLTLIGTNAVSITGNKLNNIITGNTSNNTLSGGIGADTLIGNNGNDLYIVDNVADVIIEKASQGTDTVQSSVSYTLAANVENLTITGTSAINAVGNASNNTLSGNTANNTLTGGAGDDTYLFNAGGAKDTITDTSGGNDTLIFGTGINANQLWFKHTANNLVITRIGTTDSVTIKDWYLQTATNNTHIETLKSGDGKKLLETQVDSLVQAMASFAPPAAGTTTLPSNYQTALNSVIAGSWK